MIGARFIDGIRGGIRRRERWLRAAFVLALGIVAYLSLKPGDAGEVYDGLDKWRHIAAYAALAVSGTLAYSTRRQFWALLAGLVVYGAALEYAQTFIAFRTGSWPDFGANVAGVLIGMIAMRGIMKALAIGAPERPSARGDRLRLR